MRIPKVILKTTIPAALLGTPGVAAAQEEGLRDIRGPVAYPLDVWSKGLLALLAAVILLVLLRLAWRAYQRRRAFVPPVPPVPPWETALRLLEELRDKKYVDYGKYSEYYSELSDILRRYMEDYFGIRAPEMTTEEFLASIKVNAQVSAEYRDVLGKFMQQADVVKFAKAAPTVEESERSWELARRFIMQSYEDEDDKDGRP